MVGIARGGLVPATMAAGMLALPLAMIGFERAAGFAAWIGPPPSARRILLVDDGCSTGRTMASVREALMREGRDCLTLAVVARPGRHRLHSRPVASDAEAVAVSLGTRRDDAGRTRAARHRSGAGSG